MRAMANVLIPALLSTLTSAGYASAAQQVAPGCGVVEAATLAEVCGRFSTSAGQVACFRAGSGAHLDECALGFCDTYHTEIGCTECIEAVRGKHYTPDELIACNQFTSEEAATACMEASGTPF